MIAGHVVAGAANGDVRHGRLQRHRHADRLAVVLDDEDDGQPVDAGEVEALVEVALVGGTLAELGHRHLLGAADLGGQRDARRRAAAGLPPATTTTGCCARDAVVAGHLAAARADGSTARANWASMISRGLMPKVIRRRHRPVVRHHPVVALAQRVARARPARPRGPGRR